ncbi:MAG: hypothetical protein R2741_06540 [Methanolobus sp.]
MLKADVKADFESGEIDILNVNTEGSYPEITEIDVEATLDKGTGIITVTADGKCMAGNVFHGEMQINACDEFKITENSGWVKVISPVETELDLKGDFDLYVWECCKLPEQGTYCGTLEGTYQSDDPAIPGTFDLKADFKADYNGDITISNIDTTGSNPGIDEGSLDVVAELDKEIGVITITATGTCMGGNEFYGEMRVKACDFTVISSTGYVVAGDTKYDLEGKFTITIKDCEDDPCEIPEGTVCGTLEGTYTGTDLEGNSAGPFYLKVDFVADLDSGTITVDTAESNPAVNDVVVVATLNKDTGIITVVALGTCSMEYDFFGTMQIDTCNDFAIKGTPSGRVVVPDENGLITKYDLTGTFELETGNCGEEPCEPPEGTYCGTIDGTFSVPLLGETGLKADILADFENEIVYVSNVETTGNPALKINNLQVEAELDKDTGIIEITATGNIEWNGYERPFEGEIIITGCGGQFTITSNEATVSNVPYLGTVALSGDFDVNLQQCQEA